MKYYSTTYMNRSIMDDEEQLYTGCIVAENDQGASRIAYKRKEDLDFSIIEEKPYEPASKKLEELTDFSSRYKVCGVLHDICYFVYLGLKQGDLTVEETVGDGGILHEALHLFRNERIEKSFNESYFREFRVKLIDSIKEKEAKVEGYVS